MVESLNNVSEALLARGWTMLWQWTVVAAVVGLLMLAVRQSQPAVRFWLWQLLLLKLLLMPFWMVAIERDSQPKTAGGDSISLDERRPNSVRQRALAESASNEAKSVDAAAVHTLRKSADTPAAFDALALEAENKATLAWTFWILFAWGIVVLAQLSLIVLQRRRLRRFLDSTKQASDDLIEVVAQLSQTISLQRPPQVVVARSTVTPFVCGVSRPVLVLPDGLRNSLEPMRFRQVVLHELAHLKRHDLLWGWFPAVVRIVFVFHPLVHWICSRIHLERELACDQLAMHYTDRSAASYAQTLVEAVSRSAASPPNGPHGNDDLVTKSSSPFSGAIP